MTSQLSEATHEEVNEYYRIAQKWWSTDTAQVYFRDNKFVSVMAIAEFLANQDGKSVFAGKVS